MRLPLRSAMARRIVISPLMMAPMPIDVIVPEPSLTSRTKSSLLRRAITAIPLMVAMMPPMIIRIVTIDSSTGRRRT